MFSRVWFFETPSRHLCPWGFSRQESCSGLPFPPPGDLPDSRIEPESPAALVLQAASLPTETKPAGRWLHCGRGVGQSTCLHRPDQGRHDKRCRVVVAVGCTLQSSWAAGGGVRGGVPQDRAGESRRSPRGLPLQRPADTPPPNLLPVMFSFFQFY